MAVNLERFSSIKPCATQAGNLDRLDTVILNASLVSLRASQPRSWTHGQWRSTRALPIGIVDERTWFSKDVDRTSSDDRQNAAAGKRIGRGYDCWGAGKLMQNRYLDHLKCTRYVASSFIPSIREYFQY